MKPIVTFIFFVLVAFNGMAQSKTFQTLKHKFDGQEDVYAFSASGFCARAILWVAGEHDFRDAIYNVRSFRLITIPKKAFDNLHVSVAGLKKLIKKESFEEMMHIKDHGDEVTFFIQDGDDKKDNRYFVLIDDVSQVVAIEIRGYIDPSELRRNNELSYID